MLQIAIACSYLFFRLRYKDFRDDEGNHTIFYYQLLAVRLGFVILFEVSLQAWRIILLKIYIV